MIVLASVAMIFVGVGAATVVTVASGDETPPEPDGAVAEAVLAPAPTTEAATPTAVAEPALTAPVPASRDDDLPVHHGYNGEALYVALYGSIATDRLGVLGERDVDGSVGHAVRVAEEYEGFGPTVVPTFEIIASIASFDSGDGDYSNEASIEALQPWVDGADEAGYHVVLDLQSGREAFPSQIRDFESLLLEPHVSVALDPEWRVGPDERPEGGKIGTVSGAEVNQTIDYLDELIVANELPPKMLIVHQFADKMITEKTSIRGTANVQVVVHMDGFGPLQLKQSTYARVTSNLPPGAVAGWKNFYDEDEPTPTAQLTMDHDPQPIFVSFQ